MYCRRLRAKYVIDVALCKLRLFREGDRAGTGSCFFRRYAVLELRKEGILELDVVG